MEWVPNPSAHPRIPPSSEGPGPKHPGLVRDSATQAQENKDLAMSILFLGEISRTTELSVFSRFFAGTRSLI